MTEKFRIKFKNMYLSKPHPKELGTINEVYELIKGTEKLTKKQISEELNVKKSKIDTCIKHLIKGNYISTTRKYSPPFLKVIKTDNSVESWVYGKDNRLNRCKNEQELVFSIVKDNNLDELYPDLEILKESEIGSNQFMKIYHLMFEKLKHLGFKDIVDLDVGRPANRYKVI